MALISLVTADQVDLLEQTTGQLTLIASEAITAGAPICIDSNGKWANSDGNGAGINIVDAIALKTAAAGEALTGVYDGLLGGFNFTDQAYRALIYVSDTVGRLGDATGTATLVVGKVIPVWSTKLGTNPDKALLVHIGNDTW